MKRIYIFNCLLICGIFLIYFLEYFSFSKNETINIGILFSESGGMATSEEPIMRAALLAINEINHQGGVKGKQIVPIIYDAESDQERYDELATKMILEDHVKAIIGCWTSATRKLVKPIVEKYNNLLIYPTQSEGTEQSRHIISLGAVPNQQLIPGVVWMVDHYGKRAYLVGSKQISPYVENEILGHNIRLLGGKVVGTQYIPLESMNVDDVIKDIILKQPDFIFHIVGGSTNKAFFDRLYELTTAKGIRRPPVMSFSLSARVEKKIGLKKMIGDLASWSYFVSEDNPMNHAFLKAYQKEYGSIEDVSDPVVTAYAGVYLWAQAAKQSPSLAANLIRDFMLNQSIASPAGVLYIDPKSAYTWRTVEIGRINKEAKYDIVWRSEGPIEPIVYPDFKTRAEWNIFEYQIYNKLGNSWYRYTNED